MLHGWPGVALNNLDLQALDTGVLYLAQSTCAWLLQTVIA